MQFYWTIHAKDKMRYYRLSESRVKRVINFPKRIEEGIAEDTVAMMQPGGSARNPYEIWVMVQRGSGNYSKAKTAKEKEVANKLGLKEKSLKVISAWRYPGTTKPGEKLPEEILREFRSVAK
jgi:hypothetical protein